MRLRFVESLKRFWSAIYRTKLIVKLNSALNRQFSAASKLLHKIYTIVYERISLTSRRMAGYCVELLNVIRRRPFTYLLSVLVSFGLLFCLIVISDSLMIDEPLTQV